MRIGLPFMLLASLVVHLGVGLVVFFSFHSSSSASAQASVTPSPSILLIAPQRSEHSPAPMQHPSVSSVSPNPSALPLLPSPTKRKDITSTGSPDLGFETHARSSLRMPSWETVLAPPMAPHLDSKAAIVFVLDISGSMYEPYAGTTRLIQARQTLSRYLRALPDGMPFAVTVYAESAKNSGPLVAANDATRQAAIDFIMHDFDFGGGTDLPGGLVSAQVLEPGRLLVVTDGDLNMPANDLLAKVHEALSGHPTAVTVLGIHPRRAVGDDAILQRIADQQNGHCLLDPDEKTLVASAKAFGSAQ